MRRRRRADTDDAGEARGGEVLLCCLGAGDAHGAHPCAWGRHTAARSTKRAMLRSARSAVDAAGGFCLAARLRR
jgi:hypothetical protein